MIPGVTRVDGGIMYRGEKFPGFNKPKNAPAGSPKKKVVLAKKGDKVKKIGFGYRGMSDFTKHKNEKRRKNYLARSGGIRNKSGALTKNDIFSANYWARKVLW
jgi:hypothetical protein